MSEFSGFIREIASILQHPDVIVLGTMIAVWILGFACGVLAYEIHCIKHQIRIRRYHNGRDK